MTLLELKKLVKLMHKEGIVSYKTPELELLVQPKAPTIRKRRKVEEDTLSNDFKGYTDDEILMWSAPNTEGQ